MDDNEEDEGRRQAPPAAPQEPNAGMGVPFRNGGLGAAHQALLQREGPAGYQPYLRPSFFFCRIFLLLIIMCLSLSLASTVFLTLPGKLCLLSSVFKWIMLNTWEYSAIP